MSRAFAPRLAHLTLACALVAPAAGCTKDTSEQLKGALEETIREQLDEAKTQRDAQPTVGEATRPHLLANKLGLYGACVGATQARMRASHAAVVDLFDDKGKLRAAATASANLGALAPEWVEKCIKAAKEGPHLQPPQPELEAAQASYTEALERYHDALVELRALLTDGDAAAAERGAAATALRTRLDEAHGAWTTAATTLGGAIDATQVEIDAATLAQVEERAGKGLEYSCRAFVIRARPLVRCLGESGDAAACETAFFDLEQAHGDLHAQLDAARAAGTATAFWLDPFMTGADDLYAAARDLMKQTRSGTANAATRTRLLEEFADLLRDAGKLNFEVQAPTPAPTPADEAAPADAAPPADAVPADTVAAGTTAPPA